MSAAEVYWGMPGQPAGDDSLTIKERVESMHRSFPGHTIEWYRCTPLYKSTKELVEQDFDRDSLDEDSLNVRIMGITTTLEHFSYENLAALHERSEDDKINAEKFKELFKEGYQECVDLKKDIDKKEEENESLRRQIEKLEEQVERLKASSNVVEELEEISLEERVSPREDDVVVGAKDERNVSRPTNGVSMAQQDGRGNRLDAPEFISGMIQTNKALKTEIDAMRKQLLETKKRCSEVNKKRYSEPHSKQFEVDITAVGAWEEIQQGMQNCFISSCAPSNRRPSLPLTTISTTVNNSDNRLHSMPVLPLPLHLNLKST